MNDGRAAPVRAAAEAALRELCDRSGVTGGVVLGSDGEALAATGASQAWADAAGRLLAAADKAGAAPAANVHVATADGEAFALRGPARTIVVVAPRFQLASLMLSDLRAALRRLDGALEPGGAANPAAPGRDAAASREVG